MVPSASGEELLVAAPPTLLRQGLLLTLRETWPASHVSVTTDAAQLPTLLQQQPCALLIVDDSALPASVLPAILGQVRKLRPSLPLLVLIGRRAPVLPLAAPGASALRLLPRHATPSEVAQVAAELLASGPVAPLPLAASPPPRLPHVGFSCRELEVLALVMADLCNEQIAERLCLSVRTVESHRRALLHKAGVRTPIGLVVRALHEGWVSG